MSDTTLLMLSIGPAADAIEAHRDSRGISKAQLERKWALRRGWSAARSSKRSRKARVDSSPPVRVRYARPSGWMAR